MKPFELFAINCHKRIQLKDMLNRRLKPNCIYHSQFHKVIVGGGGNIFGNTEEVFKGVEWYDINQDKWIQLTQVGLMTIANMGCYDIKISKINPNICYFTLTDNQSVNVLRMDVRDNNMHKMLPIVYQHEWI